MVPRLQLFEFMDQPWLPEAWRRYEADTLFRAEQVGDPFATAVERIAGLLDACDTPRMVDLCSGAGGPAVLVQRALAARGRDVDVLLTDLYPHLPAWERLAAPGVGFRPDPVDATAVPADLDGVRTLFEGFHHFPDPLAHAILADAARERRAIAVFEVTERSLRGLGVISLALLATLALTPSIRPRTVGRWFWTYALPVVPALVTWDGVVSCLRTRTPSEMLALAPRVTGYTWEAGRDRVSLTPMHITWLTGRPTP